VVVPTTEIHRRPRTAPPDRAVRVQSNLKMRQISHAKTVSGCHAREGKNGSRTLSAAVNLSWIWLLAPILHDLGEAPRGGAPDRHEILTSG
jgi:hypothetical protein